MGLIDVEVVMQSDSWDPVEFLTGATRTGEIDATSVNDFVHQVRSRALEESSSINRLDLYAHGTSSYMSMGSDTIHSFTPQVHMPTLRRLRGIVAASGVVTLMVCDVGQAEELICAMAKAIGALVQANAGAVRPLLGMGCGTWFVAWPNGTTAKAQWGLPPY